MLMAPLFRLLDSQIVREYISTGLSPVSWPFRRASLHSSERKHSNSLMLSKTLPKDFAQRKVSFRHSMHKMVHVRVWTDPVLTWCCASLTRHSIYSAISLGHCFMEGHREISEWAGTQAGLTLGMEKGNHPSKFIRGNKWGIYFYLRILLKEGNANYIGTLLCAVWT